ncbi:hypothetical protein [Symbioplanes lichenis]|uniref:hypothetical protein n=1 Tax=Symbioplanes lichenis TaxID=1629072 RepID=UPI00273A3702|nr:hypothetical protein [Actinoplanes lichenis]
MKALRILAATAAVLAALLAAQPATAAPARADTTPGVLAQVACRVNNEYTCVTANLTLGPTGNYHIATQGITWRNWDVIETSFVVVRYMDVPGNPQRYREYQYYGDEHDIWQNGGAYRVYRAELHCPWKCPGAVLYFDN